MGKCHPGFYCLEGSTTPRPLGIHAGLPTRVVVPITDIAKLQTHTLVGGGVCPIGHYCTAGTTSANENPCPAGTYSLSRGLRAEGECQPCPEGFFCKRGTSAYLNSPCPRGYYCPTGTKSATQYPCPAGKFTALQRYVT